jgi:hypothetical protein
MKKSTPVEAFTSLGHILMNIIFLNIWLSHCQAFVSSQLDTVKSFQCHMFFVGSISIPKSSRLCQLMFLAWIAAITLAE